MYIDKFKVNGNCVYIPVTVAATILS